MALNSSFYWEYDGGSILSHIALRQLNPKSRTENQIYLLHLLPRLHVINDVNVAASVAFLAVAGQKARKSV